MNTKFVSVTHRDRYNKRVQRRRARERSASTRPIRWDAKTVDDGSVSFKDREVSKDGRGSYRRGPKYDEFCSTPFPEAILRAEVTNAQVAVQLGETAANVSRWMAAYVEDKQKGAEQARWSRDSTVDECLEDFGAFCRRYWPEDTITGFHMEWADNISDAIDNGGRTMLLAAQRHGKSTMLRKYCAWRIAKNPDIRILWVSQTQDLAKKSVGYVLDILTQHTDLQEQVLGPGREWRPPARSNMSWTSEEFTVGVRTKIQASPTMVALGKGGSILSRDADVVIVDDMQEHKHIRSPGVRESDQEWFFTDLMSRKLPATGVAVIGSRQHTQDIYSEVIKRGDEWTIKVYPVHDPLCHLPEDNYSAHSDCMLWPEQYPYAYMLEQKAQQGEAYFQRNMMNNPKADAMILVSANDIERCKDYNRPIGRIPEGVTRLVAGIDPADAKPVAATLWGFEPGWGKRGRRHLIDIMEAEPGVRGGRDILKSWRHKYGCTLFVVEKNMAQSWWQDTEIRDFTAREGVSLKPHYTSASNKWNDASGVLSMFGHMRTDPPSITFPYSDPETRKKTDRLVKTYLVFDPDFIGNKHADDDLVMASWFPQPTMDSLGVDFQQQAQVGYPQTLYVAQQTPYIMEAV